MMPQQICASGMLFTLAFFIHISGDSHSLERDGRQRKPGPDAVLYVSQPPGGVRTRIVPPTARP